MEEWTSYSVANFVPFSAEVYLRLIERVNDAWWPLHLLTFAVGLVALASALTRYRRFTGLLLGLLWVWAGYGFFQQFYVNLNWAGNWFAWGFYLEALLLALLLPFASRKEMAPPAFHWPGLSIAVIGLAWPLVTLAGRAAPGQVEVAGIHPDPSAILTLGLVLVVVRGRWLWLLAPMPLLWCAISGLTLMVLEVPQAWPLLGAAGVAILTTVLAPVIKRPVMNHDPSQH